MYFHLKKHKNKIFNINRKQYIYIYIKLLLFLCKLLYKTILNKKLLSFIILNNICLISVIILK